MRQAKILEGTRLRLSRKILVGLLGLNLLKGHIDRLQKLLVNSGVLLDRIVIEQDVRIDTIILDNPLTCLGIIAGGARNPDVRAVHVRQGSADSDDSSPSPGTDHGAKVIGLEAPREEVTVRSGILVDQQHLRSDMYTIGDGPDPIRSAAGVHPVHYPLQTLDNHRGNVSATVLTVIDDKGLFVKLGIPVTGELIEAFSTHIRNIDVTNLASGLLLNGLDILQDPLVVLKRIFIVNRPDDYLAATLSGFLVDGELNKLVSLADQALVDIVNILEGLAVDSGDVVTAISIPGSVRGLRSSGL